MLIRTLGSASLLITLMVGCGSAQFAGSGGRKDNSPAPGSNDPANPNGTGTPGTGGAGSGNGNQNYPGGVIPGGNGNGTGTGGVPGGPGAPGAPGYPTIPGSPNYPGSTNCPGGPGGPGGPGAPGSPCGPAQTPQWGPNGEIHTTPNGVIFGKDHVFHIGNGRFENSTCREEISMLPLSGAIYFFQFEVMADNTNVNINIAKACGIDFSTGTLQLSGAGRQLAALPIQRDMTSIVMPPTTLNRGVYTVYVYAGRSDGSRGAPKWDIDDFIVGQVQINGSQPIKPGRYGTYR